MGHITLVDSLFFKKYRLIVGIFFMLLLLYYYYLFIYLFPFGHTVHNANSDRLIIEVISIVEKVMVLLLKRVQENIFGSNCIDTVSNIQGRIKNSFDLSLVHLQFSR